jgi:hypothetical protein
MLVNEVGDMPSEPRQRIQSMQQKLKAAGFVDLDSIPQVFAFEQLASALRKSGLDTLEDPNYWIGTPNQLASGWAAWRITELEERGYVIVTEHGGVALTDKGLLAARALGIDFDLM